MRGVAICLVVFQHALSMGSKSGIAAAISLLCYKVDVNVFFFLSGYLFEKRNGYRNQSKVQFLSRKAKQLLVPYLFWNGALHFVVWLGYRSGIHPVVSVLSKLGFENYSAGIILRNILTYQNYHVELYWFIYVLFLIFLFQKLIEMFKLDSRLLIGAIGLMFAVVLLLETDISIKFATGCIIFFIGRLVFVRGKGPSSYGIGLTCLCIAIFVMLWLLPFPLKWRINYKSVSLIYELSRSILMGLCGVIFVSKISAVLCNKSMGCRFMSVIGDYSFSIYLLHTPYVLGAINAVLSAMHIPAYLAVMVLLGCGICIPVLIDRFVFSKSSILCKVCLGKN